jgi:hypothetical protein
MTDRQLMQRALDALVIAEVDGNCDYEATELLRTRLAHCDRCGKKMGGEGDIHTCTPDPIGDAQDKLIAEMAAQPEQEPVAWLIPGSITTDFELAKANGDKAAPLGEISKQQWNPKDHYEDGWRDALESVKCATPPAAAPVQHVKWEDAAQAAHPKSDPQYWPESLKVRFMEKEILQLRATPPAAQPEQEPGTLSIDRLNQWLDASLQERQERKPLTDEQKQSMWIAATIDPCSHMACYLRGIADTETAYGIK